MKTYTTEELQTILAKHSAYLRGDFAAGERANLGGANLRSANLRGANLRGADLDGANLRSADLRGANLRSANLRSANLDGANLDGANLGGADLRGANLYGANLRRANLGGADLRGADLDGADLRGANLRSADLRGANLSKFCIVPEVGSFQAFKKLTSNHIAHLEIPETASRVGGLLGRKCRAESALVLAIVDVEGEPVTTPVPSQHDRNFLYEVGKTVVAENWTDDDRLECAGGIHFFLSLSEAEAY